MREINDDIVERISSGAKYRDICKHTIAAAVREEARRHKKPAEIENAARRRLHGMAGAYFSQGKAKNLNEILQEFIRTNDINLMRDACMLHASTRERLPYIDELYGKIFPNKNITVLDIACGLNPLLLMRQGINKIIGCDMHGGLIKTLDAFGNAAGRKDEYLCCDVASGVSHLHGDVALVMKLLPLLKRQNGAGAGNFLSSLNAEKIVITYPALSIGGRAKGMIDNYSESFEAELPQEFNITDRFVIGELVYIIQKSRYNAHIAAETAPE